MNATLGKKREMWDRLVLLLISRPLEGWDEEYGDITRREVERLAPVGEKRDADE